MVTSEEELIQLSALQHFAFCRRQCALIHIEQVWNENLFTAEGRILHEKVHEQGDEMREGIKIARVLALRSFSLGLSGIADVVEFHRSPDGKWIPFPVEYKHGKPKENNCDKVQLCAQTICLEEMLKVDIPSGAIFYGKTRRRLDVEFDKSLREETEKTARRLHEFIKAGRTPKAVYTKKCESCSLESACIPKMTGKFRSAEEYMRKMMEDENGQS